MHGVLDDVLGVISAPHSYMTQSYMPSDNFHGTLDSLMLCCEYTITAV